MPTGFGKTAGTVLPWLLRRVVEQRAEWPTRLVYCLPMRVLVEQTEREIKGWIERAGVDIPVNVLMGGVEQTRWVASPELPQILIGTQDMILSRALMRGYASGRGLWPMEYGLVLDDALWIIDEVQLMDVGLATTAQLRAFQRTFPRATRPRATWWMSATLQESWLRTIDHAPILDQEPVPKTTIAASLRSGGLWEVAKRLERRADVGTPDEIAKLVVDRHLAGTLSLVVVNTVKRALETFKAIDRARKKTPVAEAELRVVHARFRGLERRGWGEEFLSRSAKPAAPGRIVVATQIVEAGVDISAALLVTDLAPWPSLVQRFGRCARYTGEAGTVVVTGAVPGDDTKSVPYEQNALAAAEEALGRFVGDAGVGPRSLEETEELWSAEDQSLLARLYPYEPLHVLRRVDFLDLFDTSPDLAGADLDIGRYIRTSDEERDVRVFFRAIESVTGQPKVLADVRPPTRDELCPVPVSELDPRKRAAYALDFLDDQWRRVARLTPGMVVLLDASEGGYAAATGWDSSSRTPVPIILSASVEEGIASASEAYERDDLSTADRWKTIATHGRETAEIVRAIAGKLGVEPRLVDLLALAARWHDAGKAHDTFQAAVRQAARDTGPEIAKRRDLAKAPAWERPAYPHRPGFRHELASVLALYEVARRSESACSVVLADAGETLEALGVAAPVIGAADRVESPLTREIAAMKPEELDLVAWLVATHHGKLRLSWTSTPLDQAHGSSAIAGVCDGDVIPAFELSAADGERVTVPAVLLSLALAEMGLGERYGSSWTERASALVERYGPTTLAWLEALLRAADWRASERTTEDSL